MRTLKEFRALKGSVRGPFRAFIAGNALLGCLFAATLLIQQNAPAQTATVPEVEVTTLTQKDVPVYSEWVGTTEGLVNARVRAQVRGYLARQAYTGGTTVKKGDLLFEIDPRTFKAALDQAEAQLAVSKARLGKTQLDVKRYRPLVKVQAISQEKLDDAVQANLATKAGVEVAEAEVEMVRLNLGFTKITSPVDGVAGSAKAQIGDLVGSTQTGELTTVSTVDPIKVYFPISEKEYMKFARAAAKNGPKSDTEPNKLELILTDGSVYPHPGGVLLCRAAPMTASFSPTIPTSTSTTG